MKEYFMYNEIALSQLFGFRNTIVLYVEEIKNFFEKICYYIAKYELKI